jgi:hypothetical protein
MEIIIAPQSASEEDIKNANLAPLELEREGLYDSSDSVKAGDLFYEFLNKNFPFKSDQNKFAGFMRSVYGKENCGDLDWLFMDAANDSLPRPEIKIEAMEGEDMLGDHDGDNIYINQRLALDALRDTESCFILFVTMLVEYGNFLGNVLRDKDGKSADGSELAGRNFAYRFMEYSEADLFNSDFEFADFSSFASLASLDDKGKEQKLAIGVSGLSRAQRESIFYSLGTKSLWEGEA